MTTKKPTLSTEPYKGVRDFFPSDMFIQNHIFNVWKKTAESFGYEEYGASILEPSELYKAKSGDEIVQEQTYSFVDRGGRDVTLRPEMTPTVARMVAAKKRELVFPLRWYSIPNLFRYEKPQRGRLREHWQLNVDIFGVAEMEAELEIIAIADSLMKSFGAKEEDFEIRINSRKMMNYILLSVFELNSEDAMKVSKLIDRKEKMEGGEFKEKLEEILHEKVAPFLHVLESKDLEVVVSHLKTSEGEVAGLDDIRNVITKLQARGITSVVFSPTLMRGFDYYTGIVFEIFDTNKDNRRALFGGGRYDDLLSLFGQESVSAVGFGMGDVTIRDFLETHNLLPEYRSSAHIVIAVLGDANRGKAEELAIFLRENGLNVVTDATTRKLGDKIKGGDRQKIPFVIVFGEEEARTGKYKVKNLKTGEEKLAAKEEIKNIVQN